MTGVLILRIRSLDIYIHLEGNVSRQRSILYIIDFCSGEFKIFQKFTPVPCLGSSHTASALISGQEVVRFNFLHSDLWPMVWFLAPCLTTWDSMAGRISWKGMIVPYIDFSWPWWAMCKSPQKEKRTLLYRGKERWEGFSKQSPWIFIGCILPRKEGVLLLELLFNLWSVRAPSSGFPPLLMEVSVY